MKNACHIKFNPLAIAIFLLCNFSLGVFLMAVPLAEALPWPVHHQLKVTIDPQKSKAQIHDVISINPGPTASSTLNFLLRGSYSLETIVVRQKGDWTIDTESIKESGVRLTRLKVEKPLGLAWPSLIELEVQYSGSFKSKKKSASNPKKNLRMQENEKGKRPRTMKASCWRGTVIFTRYLKTNPAGT